MPMKAEDGVWHPTRYNYIDSVGSPRRAGLVVSFSCGRSRVRARPDHSKDHHKNDTNCFLFARLGYNHRFLRLIPDFCSGCCNIQFHTLPSIFLSQAELSNSFNIACMPSTVAVCIIGISKMVDVYGMTRPYERRNVNL